MHSTYRLDIILPLLSILNSWIALISCNDHSGFYTAAVIEHVRFGDLEIHSPDEILQKNLDVYEEAVETASANNVDIIVFPEWGLYPHIRSNRKAILPFVEDIPDPKTAMWNPCAENELFQERKILRSLSCFAQANNIFVVANMGDIKECETAEENSCDANNIEGCNASFRKCPSDGIKLFNTNVVFNRNGTLVSRYYKQHLYFETDIDLPDDPESAYFETDFGLFTTFTCFDISFKEAVDAVKEKNIKNVAFPTYWFDHFPLSSAVQFHQGWAIVNNVNLLAANVHLPGTGSMGSAIYSGLKGAIIYSYNPDGRTKLLIAQVPDINGNSPYFSSEDSKNKLFYLKDGKFTEVDSEDTTQFPEQCSRKVLGLPQDLQKDYRCFDINITNKATIKRLEKPLGDIESCNNGLCCSLEYEAVSMTEDYYLAAYSSSEFLYNTYGFCFENCYLIRCDSFKGKPCSTFPLKSKTTFERVKLKGNFTTKYVYPSVTSSGMRLVPTNEWIYETGEVEYKRQSTDVGLLSVGLQGRCYERDPNIDKLNN